MIDLTIRKATATDCLALTDFGKRAFYDAFAAQNTPEDMQLYLDSAFTADRQAAELADVHRVTLLAEHAGRLVGYAQVHFGNAPACITTPDAAELVRLYVDRGLQGQGLAGRLMAAAEAAAAPRARAIWLGVWEHNPRAIAFYKKCGFVTVGAHAFRLGRDLQTDHIMLKTLTGDGPAAGVG